MRVDLFKEGDCTYDAWNRTRRIGRSPLNKANQVRQGRRGILIGDH